MKYELSLRDHLESLLVAIPLLLGLIAHVYGFFGADITPDLLTIGVIGAGVAIFKKQLATWFLNLAQERQASVMLTMIRVAYWLLAAMAVATLIRVVSQRFFP